MDVGYASDTSNGSLDISEEWQSDSDDDDLTAAQKEGAKADALVDAWAEKTGGTRESAVKNTNNINRNN